MEKSIYLISLWVCLSSYSFAQAKSKKVDILWGQEQRESQKSTLSDIVGYDETGIYAIKKTLKGFHKIFIDSITLEHYNNKMIQTKSIDLDLTRKNNGRYFGGMMHINDVLYAFSTYKDKQSKQNLLYLQKVDKNTLRLGSEIRQIAAIDYSGNSKLNAGNFRHRISEDSTKVLVYSDLPYDAGASEKLGFHVFDHNFNQLWHQEITLPYNDELFDIENYKVDNNGNVHLVGIIYENIKREKRKGKTNYKYQLLSYYDEGRQLIEYPINIEGKFLTDMQVAINKDQDIICSGFYSDERSFGIKGSYFLKISGETKEVLSKSFKEFDFDFITQNMTQRKERKAKKKADKGKNVELYKYDLHNIILKDDGGAVLIGEQYFVSQQTKYTPTAANFGSTYFYNYNDLIVVNVAADGQIEWTEKIPKRQLTAGDGGFFSSFVYSVVKDKIYFVFNDHPKNLFYRGKGRLANFDKSKQSLVVLVELDSNGNQTREALFSSKEADILTRPRVCEQVSEKELVLFGERKTTHRFAKISFKD